MPRDSIIRESSSTSNSRILVSTPDPETLLDLSDKPATPSEISLELSKHRGHKKREGF